MLVSVGPRVFVPRTQRVHQLVQHNLVVKTAPAQRDLLLAAGLAHLGVAPADVWIVNSCGWGGVRRAAHSPKPLDYVQVVLFVVVRPEADAGASPVGPERLLQQLDLRLGCKT